MGRAPNLSTPLCSLLGCELPVLQAGMGGVARSDLVAAVSAAGGYGFLGMVRESPALIAGEIDAVRQRTERPFGVNLIPVATEAGLLVEQLAACFDKGVASLCFFWDVDAVAIARAKAAGCLVLYQVGSVTDAVAAEAAGADIIIAQGLEAGGHVRGTLSSLVLLPQVVAAVSVPVVASGGFTSGAGLVAALALGAQGIHCGTAFLATEESFAHDYHKQRVVAARAGDTVHTDAFAINWPPGSPVRVLANSATDALGGQRYGHHPAAMPREEIARDNGRPLYRYSTDSPLRSTSGELEAMALFAGQSAGAINRVITAAQRVEAIVAEASETLERLRSEGEKRR